MQTLNYYEQNVDLLINQYEYADVKEVQNLLLQTFNKKSKLLEIGCGSGRDASFMIKNDFDVVAIDGSKNMIEEAIKVHPELNSKLFHITLPDDFNFDKQFDGIYSIATLMHLSKKDVTKVINKVFNLLHNNGKFLMSISLFRDDIKENNFDEKGRFFLILNCEEWIELLTNAGFKVIQTKLNNDGLDRSGIEWLTLVAQK